MTIFLRDSQNRTFVDIELSNKDNTIDISSSIAIDIYSFFLLNNLDRKYEIIKDFQSIKELRGWLWEKYFAVIDNTSKEYDNVYDQISKMLKNIAQKYSLSYIID